MCMYNINFSNKINIVIILSNLKLETCSYTYPLSCMYLNCYLSFITIIIIGTAAILHGATELQLSIN